LRKDNKKVGLLLHGTGGLGKSCLAGKFCERYKDHILIIVHGELNAVTFHEALKDGFIRGNDDEGLKILEEREEMPDKIRRLCSSVFQNRAYLILLDDFEKNMPRAEGGVLEVSPEAVPILETLLRFLPYSGKITQLIITSRYTFPLTFGGSDLVRERLEPICLTSFLGADRDKKVFELENIQKCADEVKQQLIELGRGNPLLLDKLDILAGEIKNLDINLLLSAAKGKQEEFVQELVLKQLLEAQIEAFQTFLRQFAVYRLPVLKEGIRLVCGDLRDWKSHAEKAVRLSLMEEDSTRRDYVRYWVTPLLSEAIFAEIGEKERRKCHQAAVSYYQEILSVSRYDPVSGAELIEHALKAGLDEIAIEEGGRYLPYLRNSLAYKEALAQGDKILSHVSKPKKDDKYGKFICALGGIHHDMGNARQAIEYYEQALSIDKAVYGDRHPAVASDLNNIGSAWDDLGEPKKAIEYFKQALSIDKAVYGDRHPAVAAMLNNIGLAWYDLGEPKKAIEYFKQALSIGKEVYGDRHPDVATDLNNIGLACDNLGEYKKAILYYEQALSIGKEVYGDRHPDVATELNNIGGAWDGLDEHKKAIEYYEQALSIDREVYGDRHPDVAIDLSNIGLAWDNLGEYKKAILYHEQALSIDREVYGDRHPDVARDLNNIGGTWYALGDSRRAKEYFQQAYSIISEFYGDEHPHTRTAKEWLDSLKGT
jgi:tetratricopeptide (TPR) repeat protein